MVEIPKILLRRAPKSENNPVPDIATQIKNIALNAADIWTDNKRGDKNERYKAEARKLLSLVATEIENPNFYDQLNIKEHIRVLQLLSTFVPDIKEYEDFKETFAHRITVVYLKGLLEHRESIRSGDENGINFDTEKKTVSSLRVHSGIKRYYLDEVFDQNGLNQKSSLTENTNGHVNNNLLPSFTFQKRQ